jgi:very-short-patch-repair endonuclease
VRKPGEIVQGQPVAPRTLVFAKEMRRAMTPEERILWNQLRRNQIKELHFRRQQIIAGYIVDFYCDAARLAVELDGTGHDAEYDANRDSDLVRIGVRVLRIRNQELLENVGSVLERIVAEASDRAARPNP